MRITFKRLMAILASLGFLAIPSWAQTDGNATFRATLVDYNGSGTKHWTVAWVTTEAGGFIKSLRKQGPTITSSHWNSHCRVWYEAKGSNNSLDGYSSATAQDYSGTNSPVVCTWNCRDANNNLMPDGNYVFWVQYAEDSGQGPYTTNGMAWVKGPAASTNTYPNQQIRNMQVVWTPLPPPTIAAVEQDGGNLILRATGPVGKTCYVLAASDLTGAGIAWDRIATNQFDNSGQFSFTNAIDGALPQKFYQLQVP